MAQEKQFWEFTAMSGEIDIFARGEMTSHPGESSLLDIYLH